MQIPLSNCECGGGLHAVRFYEIERRANIPTGRIRNAVSHLSCDACMRNVCVDDSLDGPWRQVTMDHIRDLIKQQSMEFGL